MRSIRDSESISAMCMPAPAGECDHWVETPKGPSALIVLLDQFSRNLFRGDAWTFAIYVKALEIADAAIEKGYD